MVVNNAPVLVACTRFSQICYVMIGTDRSRKGRKKKKSKARKGWDHQLRKHFGQLKVQVNSYIDIFIIALWGSRSKKGNSVISIHTILFGWAYEYMEMSETSKYHYNPLADSVCSEQEGYYILVFADFSSGG